MTSCLNLSPSASHMLYFVYFFLFLKLKTGIMCAEEPENDLNICKKQLKCRGDTYRSEILPKCNTNIRLQLILHWKKIKKAAWLNISQITKSRAE